MKKLACGLALAAGVAALLPAGPAGAAYPERPIRVMIGFPPGGAIDTIGRLIAPRLSERLGQSVVIENKAGAGGIIALQQLLKSEPDGYTVLMGTMGNLSISPGLVKDFNADMEKDVAAVTIVGASGMVLYANPKSPFKSVPEMIRYAKAHPEKINFSSSGNGGLPHMAGELFKTATGTELTHIPYSGSNPAVKDVVGGQVDVTFEATAIGLPFVQSGQLLALGTTGKERSPVMPGVPTIGESVPGYEVTNWYGVIVPGATPAERIATLQKAFADVLAEPEIKDRLASLGVTPDGRSPQEAAAYMNAERKRWMKVIKENNISTQ